MNYYEIEFKYADSISNWEWRRQSCFIYADTEHQAQQKCIKLYGLGIDCEYEIINTRRVTS